MALLVLTGCSLGSQEPGTTSGSATSASSPASVASSSTSASSATTSTTAAVTIATESTTGGSEMEQLTQALQESEDVAADFSIEDYFIAEGWAGVHISSPTVGSASVVLRQVGGGWEMVALGSDLDRDQLVADGVPDDVADFVSPWIVLEVIGDVIADSGSVAVDFEITDFMLRGKWAGVIIASPGLEDARVLLMRGLKGWAVLDLGTGLTREDWLSQGAPEPIADFLS